MDKANESIKKYRQDVLADFLNNVLEIEKEESVLPSSITIISRFLYV